MKKISMLRSTRLSISLINNSGASLLELVVGMMIAMLLLLSIEKIILSIEQAWQIQQQAIGDIEKMIVTKAWFTHAIQQAGYLGCVMGSHRSSKTIIDPGGYLKNQYLTIENHQQQLNTQYMKANSVKLLNQLNTQQLWFDTQARFKSGQVVIISDCHHVWVNKIIQINYRQHKTQQLLTFEWPIIEKLVIDQVHIGQLIQQKFLLKLTNRFRSNGTKINSLYLYDQNQRWHELVEGVSDLFIKYIDDQVLVKLVLADSQHEVNFILMPENNYINK